MTGNESRRILVWDLPTRVFHWLMVVCFAIAYFTSSDDRLAVVHAAAGFTILGLLFFRMLWGFAGSRYSRFSSFVRGPRKTMNYLRGLCSGEIQHCTGHNPAGGVAILLLLILGLVVTITGALLYQEIGWPMLEEIHETSTDLMLAVVAMHVSGVIASSFLHKENLAKAMITGFKFGSQEQGIEQSHRLIGFFILVITCGFWFWFVFLEK
jgi:cytochrome b